MSKIKGNRLISLEIR